MRNAAFRVATAVVLLTAWGGPALAADNLNVSEQRFSPSPHPYDYLAMMSSHIPDTWVWNAGLFFDWAASTMIFEDALGEQDEVLTGRLTANLVGNVSFYKYASLGIVFPLYMANITGTANAAFDPGAGAIDRGAIEGFSWGDLRISPKVRILDSEETMIGVAVALDLTVPTGKKDAFATDDGVTVMPRLIVDMNIKGYRAALNIGYKWRDEYSLRWLKVGPEFTLGIAASIPVIEHNLDILGELETTAKTSDFFSDENTDYLEGRLAARYTTDYGLGVTAGGAAGFLTAYGSPLYRFFAGVHYSPRHISRDMDGDGLEDDVDKCPTIPEDFDGFEDEDGCPDPDNDEDGILDVNDKCPMDPEDRDGFQDEDGCPDPDNDQDGILDVNDACPMEPEDVDQFQDEDGCPDPDNDGDRILDRDDKCPMEPENYNNCQDEDGCPEAGKVCVTDEKIVIMDKVFFQTNRATILKKSFPILDEVASVLKEHPEILKVLVEGHTDDRGNDRYNLKLSKARAAAVMAYLVKAGVDKKRLQSEGYGETKAIAPNETEDGRAMNRRVEFTILDRTPK